MKKQNKVYHSYRTYRTYNSEPAQRTSEPKKSIVKFRTITLLFSIVFIGAIGYNVLLSQKESQAAMEHGQVKQAAKQTVAINSLPAELLPIISQYPYTTSVSVLDINSGSLVQAGDDYPFVAASTTKLLTALAFFNQVEAGKMSLDSSINGQKAEVLLQKMINMSDNDAWRALNDTIGKPNIEAYAKQHGLSSYNAEKNTVTSNDIARLLGKMYKNELVNEKHTNKLYGWMQNTSEEQFIPPSVPKNMKLFHKAGYLNDRAHDVAIIDNGKTPLVLVIYSKSSGPNYNFTKGEQLFKQVTDQVLSRYKAV